MCQLPRTQPDSVALANNMIAGFTEHPDTFPLADTPQLQASLDSFYQARESFTNAKSIYKQAGQKQRRAFEELKDVIANQIKVAQVDTSDNPVKLGFIGYGPRRKKSSMSKPAQPHLLDAKPVAAGVVKLQWKKDLSPACGPVGSFNIESRIMNNGDTTNWSIAGLSFDCDAVLKDQPQGKRLEYRVTAANHSGRSMPSNVLAVIL